MTYSGACMYYFNRTPAEIIASLDETAAFLGRCIPHLKYANDIWRNMHPGWDYAASNHKEHRDVVRRYIIHYHELDPIDLSHTVEGLIREYGLTSSIYKKFV